MFENHKPIPLLDFVRSERVNLFFVSIISLCIFFFSTSLIKLFAPPLPSTELVQEKLVEIDTVESEQKKEARKNQNHYTPNPSHFTRKKKPTNQISPSHLFAFDPNTASKEQFIELGLTPKVASIILNYRKKGGKFYKKEDLQKIYGISQSDFEALEPFIKIAAKPVFVKQKSVSKPKKKYTKTVIIDINKASAKEWQMLKGIGKYYSEKIVNFREKLGGFSSVDQIATTYGLRDSTFQVIRPFLKPSPIFRKLKINQADVKTMSKHPYIKWNQAKLLDAYRYQHGAYHNLDEVRSAQIFSEESLARLAPYLDFSE